MKKEDKYKSIIVRYQIVIIAIIIIALYIAFLFSNSLGVGIEKRTLSPKWCKQYIDRELCLSRDECDKGYGDGFDISKCYETSQRCYEFVWNKCGW